MNNLFQAFLLIVTAPLSILFALLLNKRHNIYFPNSAPYRWGYYCGFQFIFISIAIIILQFILDNNISLVLFLLFASILYATFGFLSLFRLKWSFIVLTILTLNPITWIINISYIRNRKGEFRNEKKIEHRNNRKKPSLDKTSNSILH